MCKPASFVLTKDQVFFSQDSDSHEDIILEFKLTPNTDEKIVLLQVEIVPPKEDYRLPLSKWYFKVDQDLKPDWFDAKTDEKRTRAKLKDWKKSHFITSGEVSKGQSRIVLSGSVKVSGGKAEFYGSSQGTVSGGEAWFWGSSQGKVSGGDAWFSGSSQGKVSGGKVLFSDSSHGTVSGGKADFSGSSQGKVSGGKVLFYGSSKKLN